MSDEILSEMTEETCVAILDAFNKWRRGEGAYGFTDNPEDYRECPYTPKQIGEAIDFAIEKLRY